LHSAAAPLGGVLLERHAFATVHLPLREIGGGAVTDFVEVCKDLMMTFFRRDLSDADLAARTLAEPELFGELYRRHEPSVLGYFRHWSASPEVAADLTAETFALALSSISGYQHDRGEFVGWLFGIARHVLARSLERGRVEDTARQRLGMATVSIDTDTIERIEALASLDGAVLDLLAELPNPIRDAINGRVLEEREYHELAESLACSQSLVRQRVKRGLARLRDRLEATQ
jgi:RNA polymerase sigma factor (sigma-70 family)